MKAYRPLYPREKAPSTHWVGGWVGYRASMDDIQKRKFLTVPGLELRPSAVQLVPSRYTNYAIPATLLRKKALG
jgi:hypothetical protein